MSPTEGQPEDHRDDRAKRAPTHLTPVRFRGNVVVWGIIGAVGCAVGMLLLTGLASSPWLFLLYPLLIGGEIFSLGVLALALLRRL